MAGKKKKGILGIYNCVTLVNNQCKHDAFCFFQNRFPTFLLSQKLRTDLLITNKKSVKYHEWTLCKKNQDGGV